MVQAPHPCVAPSSSPHPVSAALVTTVGCDSQGPPRGPPEVLWGPEVGGAAQHLSTPVWRTRQAPPLIRLVDPRQALQAHTLTPPSLLAQQGGAQGGLGTCQGHAPELGMPSALPQATAGWGGLGEGKCEKGWCVEGGRAGAPGQLASREAPCPAGTQGSLGLVGEKVGGLSSRAGRVESYQAPLTWVGRGWGRTSSSPWPHLCSDLQLRGPAP